MTEKIVQFENKPQRWAKKIRQAHAASVQAIIETGRLLIEAKADCDHGEWGEITGETTGHSMLPFSAATARMYMAIASHQTLTSNRYRGNDLPASWRTLYELSQIDPTTLDQHIQAGRVHPNLTRSEAEALKAPSVIQPQPTRPTTNFPGLSNEPRQIQTERHLVDGTLLTYEELDLNPNNIEHELSFSLTAYDRNARIIQKWKEEDRQNDLNDPERENKLLHSGILIRSLPIKTFADHIAEIIDRQRDMPIPKRDRSSYQELLNQLDIIRNYVIKKLGEIND